MGRSGQEKTEQALPHGLTLQDRHRMTLSGVRDVVNFDEGQVILNTSLGTLTIKGSELHVDQLSLESGEVSLTGKVDVLEYDDEIRGGGLLGRLFR